MCFHSSSLKQANLRSHACQSFEIDSCTASVENLASNTSGWNDAYYLLDSFGLAFLLSQLSDICIIYIYINVEIHGDAQHNKKRVLRCTYVCMCIDMNICGER